MTRQGANAIVTLGAGCFWCLDAAARRTAGIVSSVVGYAGGHGDPPDYYSLHEGSSHGWVEAVQIVFDTAMLPLEDVLSLFFQSHDPTTANQDGANFGPEYHSTIFYHDDDQANTARKVIEEREEYLGKKIITSLRPYTTFFEGEPEHQDFYNRNRSWPYCRIIIDPKLEKLGLAD